MRIGKPVMMAITPHGPPNSKLYRKWKLEKNIIRWKHTFHGYRDVYPPLFPLLWRLILKPVPTHLFFDAKLNRQPLELFNVQLELTRQKKVAWHELWISWNNDVTWYKLLITLLNNHDRPSSWHWHIFADNMTLTFVFGATSEPCFLDKPSPCIYHWQFLQR